MADLKERQYYGLLPQWEKPNKFKFQGKGLGWEEERNLEDQLAEVSEHLIGLSGAGKEQAEELFISPSAGGLPFVSNLTVEYEDQNKLESLYQQIQQRGGGLNFWGKRFWKEEFTYDPNGNVINKKNGWGEINYTYNESNQLLQAGNRSYQYDSNGNLLREELGASYAEYEYSPENRLITVRNNAPQIYPDWSFVGEINYAYDALGRKVSKEINPEKGNKGNREYYLYAGLGIDIIAQYEMEMHSKKPGKGKNPHDPAGKLTRVQEYYYGNGFLLAAKTIDKPEKHGYGPGGKGKGWGNIDPLKDVTFYHQDALGSVVMLTGHNGQVVERYEYDVYGVAYNGKFDHGLAGMGGNSYGFTGKRYEQEMGVYSFAFRDYNPRSMRWMTEDPIKDEVNWYQYCGSDPVNWVDFTGLWGKEIHYGSKEYGGTLQWAQDVGFTEKEATIIAKADQNVDSPSSGKCPLPVIGDQRYHFNTNRDVESGSIGDSRKVVAEEHLQKAIDLQNEANALRDSKKGSVLNIIGDAVKENKAGKLENNALQELGTGLHSIQDMSAHKDVFVEEGSILGVDYLHHLGEKGKEADDPGHPQSPNERYYQALNDTKAYLQRFKEETECK